jgi:hypothetical protein
MNTLAASLSMPSWKAMARGKSPRKPAIGYRFTVEKWIKSLTPVGFFLWAHLKAEKWTDGAPQRHAREYLLDSRQESVSVICPLAFPSCITLTADSLSPFL